MTTKEKELAHSKIWNSLNKPLSQLSWSEIKALLKNLGINHIYGSWTWRNAGGIIISLVAQEVVEGRTSVKKIKALLK